VPYETAAALPVDVDLTRHVFLVHPVGVLLETNPEIMQAMEELDGVLVWSRIRLGGRAHSKIVVGTSVNTVRYRDGILLPTFVGMASTTHTRSDDIL
jgi:hypothetical protein